MYMFSYLHSLEPTFIGSHDRTVCFNFGGVLKDWLPTNDSWK